MTCKKIFFIPLFLILCIGYNSESISAQEVQLSFYPGINIVNSDQVSADSRVGQTNRVIGFGVSLASNYRGLDLEISSGYAEGISRVLNNPSMGPTTNHNSIHQRYRTIPLELLWVNRLADRFSLMAGLNVVGQHRILGYRIADNNHDDRLLSFGAGLSGKAALLLQEFADGNGKVFINLSVRWTEFFLHNSAGRNTDDYTYRHVMVSPQIGISFSPF